MVHTIALGLSRAISDSTRLSEDFVGIPWHVGLRHDASAGALDQVTQHAIGLAREDIVGSDQRDVVAIFLDQEAAKLKRVLVGRCTGIDDVRGVLESLIIGGIQQQAVATFECRDDGLAAGRRHATENDADAVFGQKFVGEPAIFENTGSRIVTDRCNLPAKNSPGRVDLLDRQRGAAEVLGLRDLHDT